MDWDKVKRIFVILLILLNCGLAGLNYNKNQKNTLSQSQEKAVFEVLSQNGISLYTELIRDFSPRKRMSVTVPSYSREELKRMFFGQEDIVVTVEFDHTILKSATKTLSVKQNQWHLEFINTNAIENFGQNTAKQASEQFIKTLKNNSGAYHLNSIHTLNEGYQFEYVQMYQKQPVFCSYVDVSVTQNGIARADGYFFTPMGFFGEKKEICSSDEALLTFMKERSHTGDTSPVTVEKIELGYDLQDKIEAVDGLKLVPSYRIYVLGEIEPYVINAYTNEMKKQ